MLAEFGALTDDAGKVASDYFYFHSKYPGRGLIIMKTIRRSVAVAIALFCCCAYASAQTSARIVGMRGTSLM